METRNRNRNKRMKMGTVVEPVVKEQEQAKEFVVPIVNVSTLKDLITIGTEYEKFQKDAKDIHTNYVEKLRAENKEVGSKLLKISVPITTTGERDKKNFKRTVARNKIKIKASNDAFETEFSNTDYGRLVNIVSELKELDNMIGLSKLKDSIAIKFCFLFKS